MVEEDQFRKCLLKLDWKKVNVTPIFSKGRKADSGKYRLVSLTLSPGKIIEQLILETISRHMKDKKIIRSSQHEFNKGEVMLDQCNKLLQSGQLRREQWILSTWTSVRPLMLFLTGSS